MLRIHRKTMLLAAAIFAAAGFALLSNQYAAAQETDAQEIVDTQDCPPGTVGAGYGGAGHGWHNTQMINCRPQYFGQPELFYNYYVPGTCGGVPAAMYLAPQPVPASVGHTYYTYQPFMPHELLYQHHRTYYRYYDAGRGMTRTHISWSRPPFSSWYSSLRIAR